MDKTSFFSVDRLVEFGLSIAVATQMAASMNRSLEHMQVPGAGRPLGPEDQPVYYVALDDVAKGPLSSAELSRLVAERRVTRETYVWKPGMADWQLAESLPEVLGLVALTPPPLPSR